MTMIDPEQERQRLAQFYAGQLDEELEKVASEADDLTTNAREALRAELTKRGLYVGQLDDNDAPVEHDNAQFRDLVTVRMFSSLAEAEVVKSVLEAAGIQSFLFDENVGRIYLANVVGGFRLRVDAANVDAANQSLEEAVIGDEVMEESDLSDDSST